MKYEQIKELEEEKFRRLTGVKKVTFYKMVDILQEAEIKKKARGGRKNKLSRPSAKQGFELTQQLRACSSIFMF